MKSRILRSISLSGSTRRPVVGGSRRDVMSERANLESQNTVKPHGFSGESILMLRTRQCQENSISEGTNSRHTVLYSAQRVRLSEQNQYLENARTRHASGERDAQRVNHLPGTDPQSLRHGS